MPKLQDNLRKIEVHKIASPHYRELLDIYGEILILRESYRRRLGASSIFDVDPAHVRQKLAGGLPLVDLSQKNLDLSEPKAYFIELMKIAEKINLDESREIVQAIEDGELFFEDLVRETFESFNAEYDQESEEEEPVFDLLGFFIEESLRPALELVAERYAETIRQSNWSEGYCPVCSREPKIGKLKDDEGRRFLFCSQCATEWSFNRIKCPFCGNEEQSKLSYFTVEDDERHRVEVCDQCKRYIKTFDLSNTQEEPNLDIEDIATIHLDMLANEEGYN